MSAVNRLLLVRHGTTSDTRAGRFPATSGSVAVEGCAPLDRQGMDDATALRGHLPPPDHVWSSLAVRARQTAEHAGFHPQPNAQLAECDFGAWAGKDPRTIHRADPGGLAAWYADPDRAPHGGEGLPALRVRARGLLGQVTAAGGTALAFTHGGLIRAVLLEALGLPASVLWTLDVAPASVTEIHLFADARARLTHLNWAPRLSRAAVEAA